MPVEKPFTDYIALELRDVVSPNDERDFILKEPPEIDLPLRLNHDNWFDILNQYMTDFCTAFAGFRNYANGLTGAMRDEFTEIFTNDTAVQIANWQMSWINKNFIKKLLRMDIWLWRGRNMRAMLWNLNKGVKLKNGDVLKIDAYLRIGKITDPELICRYIFFYGTFASAIRIRGNNTFDKSGRYVGTGRITGGHAIEITGFDLEREIFYFTNSWGDEFARMGKGTIPFDRISEIVEMWQMQGARFYKKNT